MPIPQRKRAKRGLPPLEGYDPRIGMRQHLKELEAAKQRQQDEATKDFNRSLQEPPP